MTNVLWAVAGFLVASLLWFAGFAFGHLLGRRKGLKDADHWMNEAITARDALQTAKREPPTGLQITMYPAEPSVTHPNLPPDPVMPNNPHSSFRGDDLSPEHRAEIAAWVMHGLKHKVRYGTVDELMPRVEDEPS